MTLKLLFKIFNRNLTVLTCMLFSFSAFAQEGDSRALSLHVESVLKRSQQSNILNTVAKIENRGEYSFSGRLKIDAPGGLRSISGSSVKIEVAATDSMFVPIRFLVNPSVESGDNQISFELVDSNGEHIDEATSVFAVSERVDLSLTVENQNIMITNAADSLRIVANVINNGNKAQDVVVVFSIPTMKKGINFVEQNIHLEPQQQHRFVLSFLPQQDLISQNQFSVKVAAMYGREKSIFGNSSVSIQNVSNNRTFEDPASHHGLYGMYDRNAISISHRSTNYGSGITQLNGSADIDLPAGFLNLKGNIYKYGTGGQMIATNTAISYLLSNNEYLIGNVYESLETSLSGRGAKVRLGSPQRNNLTIGVIDQEYNLFSKLPMFSDSYSAFAKGELSLHKQLRKVQGSLIYQRNGREMSNDLIAGGELGWLWQNKWSATLRMHGAMSRLMTDNSDKPSASAELRYNGESRGFNLSGNYYISSNYFPGNRRGVMSAQQSLSKKISEFSIRSNAYYSRFTPRSHIFPINTATSNFMGDADLYFPRLGNVTFGLGYQNQFESTNSYNQSQAAAAEIKMQASRLRASLMWSSQKTGHSTYLAAETGRSTNSATENGSEQYRFNISHSYKWFNLMTQYQRGSYYISEQLSSGGSGKPYERLISSASVNKRMFEDRLSIMASIGLNKDYYSDFSPSGYINLRYNATKRFSLFVNSNWYSYKFKNMSPVNTYSNELGLTVHLHGNRASVVRKSRVKAFVYHDNNSNGIYDEGDKPAKGYPVSINKKPFITNDNGEVTYRRVPFGKYNIGAISERGWFGEADTLRVNRFRTTVRIPLQQAGVVSGQIKYNFDPRASMEIDPKIEGIIFQITSSDGVIRHRVSTNDDASFTAFLPTGEYRIELVTASLPANTTCEAPQQVVKVVSGKILKLEPYVIDVQQKKVNMKRFGE